MAIEEIMSVRKALDTTVGTTGATLVPKILSEGIRMFVETRSPLYAILDRFTWDTNAYGWKEQTGLPVASFGAELAALPAAQNATYVERSVPMRSIYIRGELSGQIIDSTRSVMNVLTREINNSSIGMVRTIEDKIISGDSTARPNEFDGLDKQITTEVDVAASGNDSLLTLAFLDQLVDRPEGGEPTHLIMSKPMHRKLWALIQPQVRYLDRTEVAAGLRVPVYNELPIIRLFDNSAILADRILAPDMRFVYMPVLRDITYEELAKTRDSVDYFLRMYCTLVVEGQARYHAKLVNVTHVNP